MRWAARTLVLAVAVMAGGSVVLVARPARSRTIIAYGDTRFTDPSNTTATNPAARRALIARIAKERPDAVVISGDLPWHGGSADDYAEYRRETLVWRTHKLRILPALGNHEFSQCEAMAACLENWWTTFPELRGRRWYSAPIEPNVQVVALDTMSPLTDGSDQRRWLECELSALSPRVQFVVIALHHPPVADIQTRLRVDHNPRPNEIALADYLRDVARSSAVRFLVIAGHIHNYERTLQDDVMYVVSGGGGAVPYEVERTAPDLYQGVEFPNFHYVKITVRDGTLVGEMHRLDDPAATVPHFTVRDTFELHPRGAGGS